METSRNAAIVPYMVTHPTAIIKDELNARGMSQKELAERMDMKPSNLSRLLKGENLTPSIAAKLEYALDIPANLWLSLQTQYDKDVKAVNIRDEQERASFNTERMLSTILNLPELYKRLNINTSFFIQKKLQVLEDLLGFQPLDIREKRFAQQICYKKSDKLNIDEKNQATWLTLAYINARGICLESSYSKGNALTAAKEISRKVHIGNLSEKEIQHTLNNNGIVYAVVEKLEKATIYAVSIKMENHPAIVTTHRHNDMSRLVFNILHELGHIELHMNEDANNAVFVSFDEAYSIHNSQEKEANEFAENMLIDQVLWKKIMHTETNSLYSSNIVNKLRRLSEENHLDFNIVIWRYKYESHHYNLCGVKPTHIR